MVVLKALKLVLLLVSFGAEMKVVLKDDKMVEKMVEMMESLLAVAKAYH